MITVFDRIPKEFVDRYDASISHWAKNFRRIGNFHDVMLCQPVEALPGAADTRRIIGVRLWGEPDFSLPGRPRMVVRPGDEANEEAIRRHVFDLKALEA